MSQPQKVLPQSGISPDSKNVLWSIPAFWLLIMTRHAEI